MTEVTYEFSVMQDEDEVAAGAAGELEPIMREAGHYAAQYRQAGPVAVYVWKSERTDIWSEVDPELRQ